MSGLNAIIGSDHLVKDAGELGCAIEEIEKRIDSCGDAEPVAEYAAFMAAYSHLFDLPAKWTDWLECIQLKRGALNQFFHIVTFTVRMGLEHFVNAMSENNPLATHLESLWRKLDEKLSKPVPKAYRFRGDWILDLDSALALS